MYIVLSSMDTLTILILLVSDYRLLFLCILLLLLISYSLQCIDLSISLLNLFLSYFDATVNEIILILILILILFLNYFSFIIYFSFYLLVCINTSDFCWFLYPAAWLNYFNFRVFYLIFSSVQFSSIAQSCLTLCNPMNHNTPGLPVHHQLPEFTQTHVYRVRDAIQPSHPLFSPSPPAPNPSQHQGLFQWGNSSHEVLSSANSNSFILFNLDVIYSFYLLICSA